jgi:hypothetical protein
MALDLLGALLEGHDGLDARHLTEGIGALVEAIPAGHHLTVADRRTLRTVNAHIRRGLGQQSHQQIDAVDLDGDVRHAAMIPPDKVGPTGVIYPR